MDIKHLYQRAPCKDCPFKKDCLKGWLGQERMTEILQSKSFTCHKTDKGKQCAGFMLMKGKESEFVSQADRMGIALALVGENMVFPTEAECIQHHTYDHKK